MKNLMTFALALLCAGFVFGQGGSTAPAPPPTNTPISQPEITATPKIAAVYQVGETATVQFRARVGEVTTSNLKGLPVVVGVSDLSGHDVFAATTQCQLEIGFCSVRSDKPRVLLITVWLNGVFGLQQVALNFVNLRLDFPANVDVTASMIQGQEGAASSLIATSPVSINEPVTVRAEAIYVNASDSASRSVYFPNGIRYGQRVVINTETMYPLSFRDRRSFRVQFYGPNNTLVAEGFGSTVGSSEWRSLSAQLDDNGDLVFTLDAPYSATVDYTVVLLRGNQFRVELAQSRNEIYVYAEGAQTKIVFNRGSLGDSAYLLPNGFYSVNVRQFDRSNSIRFNQASADALSINGQYLLQ